MPNRIKELRQEKKITQLQLSLELGVTQETISAYEHGKHLPSLTALMKMNKLFDASMDYIMGLSNVRKIECLGNINDEQCQHLIYYYQKLGTQNKLRLISYAEGLLDSQTLS